MLKIRTILHPTDFSDHSMNAFHLACSLAKDHGARVVLLHIIMPPQPDGYYELPVAPVLGPEHIKQMEARLREMHADPTVELDYRVEVGFAASEILRVAGEVKASMIVMGTHGRTGLGRLLMGSVAEQVVRKSPCSVLTVKTPLSDDAEQAVPVAGAASR